MVNNLRVISYNCHSFNAKHDLISPLLDKCDLLCLQKTVLHEDNSIKLFNLGQDFRVSYVPALRNSMKLAGRCSRGLANIWRKSDTIAFQPINFFFSTNSRIKAYC